MTDAMGDRTIASGILGNRMPVILAPIEGNSRAATGSLGNKRD